MNQLQDMLIRIDTQLERISVCGADAYRMINARNLIKALYDLVKEQQKGDVSNDG